ncbi:hypothetical protein [Microbacterium sp. cx-59]|uniref:hypothetical protein n=1 Tax=Microbacterium sp. cx-59 TaxID=2891207 RepID=UPI001E5EA147|nr:hypothetical protein [Microbacterium sp. cx-59]MCC4909171.1 hypothetical protein [Microbacterium sp. cx-59]
MSRSTGRFAPRGRRPGQILRSAVDVWWATLSSGRFFTWWSAAVSLVVSVTILGAYSGIDLAREYVPALGISVLSWSLLVLGMLPIAYEERRMRTPLARGLLVLSAIVVVSGIRPLLNDALALLLLPDPTVGGWPQRIATNLLVWMLLLSLVAVATVGYSTTEAVNQRLRRALAALAVADRRADAFARESRVALADRIGLIRLELAALTADAPGFDDVRRFSEVVRAASHDLEDRAGIELAELRVDTAPAPAAPRAHRPFLTRLRPPPTLSVPIAYLMCSLPYMLQVAPWYLILIAAVLAIALGRVADVVSRRPVRRSAQTRGAVLLAAWLVVGVAITAAGLWLLPAAGVTALVPLIAFPGVAVVAALCTDAVHRSRVRSRLLTRALADEAVSLTARTTRTREMLRTAAGELHGSVQGRCVVFAAALEDAAATPAEAADFRIRIEAALDAVLAPAVDSQPGVDEIGDMIAAWSHVLEIRAELDPEAVEALSTNRGVSQRVAAVASEGFVNAVKHAGARHAALSVRAGTVDDRPVLQVEVVSRGVLAPGIGPLGRGVRHVGGEVSQRGDSVVLAATVAL